MPIFKNKKIEENIDVISQALKEARQKQSLSLEAASRKLKIRYEYLYAIENGDFNSLPAGLYGKNFLRRYCALIKLDCKELLNVYDEIYIKHKKSKVTDIFSHKKPRAHLFFTVPRILKNFVLILIALVCIGYLGYYVYNIISPPNLIIIHPVDNLTISENHIKIEGKTEVEAKVIINNEVVLTSSDGFFERIVNLKTGVNNIVISAQKKYSRQNKIIRNILVENKQTQ